MTATAPLSLVHHTGSSSLGTYLLAVAALVIGVLAGFILRPVVGRRARPPGHAAPTRLSEPAPAPTRLSEPAPAPTRLSEPAPAPTRLSEPAPAPTPLSESGQPTAAAPRQAPPSPQVPDAKAERDLLVQACIRTRDLVGGGALRQVLGDALMRAGVTEVDPTGQPFDPDLHCSVGVTHTADPGMADTVAAAERVGYEDRGRQLRPPEVIVFTAEGGW
jgi:GrpE